ncbi:hypothetical protein [Paenibacillus radicis (ex Xue et al. 2023)]|uniref:Uncharacterized protein n=1 Tax=Paenibacillus radicis (ex Xue et al. 2023) TaxID=2972489 RepID=A0ABT1YJX0_9BACL|nr:hypothetical protein [Paenibacillus radicis (ex Xue et al. 2023)]MCR8633488.1 hypothetical protein [Paenibacillus radicis (ex Xue et al. 2023)]
MTNKILTSETYHEEIRGRLGVGDDTVSNSDIDALSVMPIAEAKIIASVPKYADLTADDVTYLYAAAICMVAAILAPTMPGRIKKSKKDFDFSYENQSVNWTARATELVDEAYSMIDMISIQTEVNIPIFGLSGPTRAIASGEQGCKSNGDSHV